MFSFTKEQKIVEISNICFGGQPGRYPTVLFGGFFFRGKPDIKKAETQLKKVYNLSNKTGNPAVPDFFIKKEEYIPLVIDFIKKNVPVDLAFSVDIIEPELKIKTLEMLDTENLLSRTIYNSIHIGITEEEKKALEKHTPIASILVAFNPKDKSSDGKIEVLETGANLLDKGLLKLSEDLGIEKVLVDTAAMAPGDYSGASIAAIPVIKEEYGLPTGCAIHNVVEKSEWVKSFDNSRKTVDSASNINIALFGGDFAVYGPVFNSDLVFPVMAWEDILVSEYVENYFGIEPVDFHPRRKLF